MLLPNLTIIIISITTTVVYKHERLRYVLFYALKRYYLLQSGIFLLPDFLLFLLPLASKPSRHLSQSFLSSSAKESADKPHAKSYIKCALSPIKNDNQTCYEYRPDLSRCRPLGSNMRTPSLEFRRVDVHQHRSHVRWRQGAQYSSHKTRKV